MLCLAIYQSLALMKHYSFIANLAPLGVFLRSIKVYHALYFANFLVSKLYFNETFNMRGGSAYDCRTCAVFAIFSFRAPIPFIEWSFRCGAYFAHGLGTFSWCWFREAILWSLTVFLDSPAWASSSPSSFMQSFTIILPSWLKIILATFYSQLAPALSFVIFFIARKLAIFHVLTSLTPLLFLSSFSQAVPQFLWGVWEYQRN